MKFNLAAFTPSAFITYGWFGTWLHETRSEPMYLRHDNDGYPNGDGFGAGARAVHQRMLKGGGTGLGLTRFAPGGYYFEESPNGFGQPPHYDLPDPDDL